MTKTAIVTGGAGDIGKAIARGLRETGWNLALVDVAATVHETAVRKGHRSGICYKSCLRCHVIKSNGYSGSWPSKAAHWSSELRGRAGGLPQAGPPGLDRQAMTPQKNSSTRTK